MAAGIEPGDRASRWRSPEAQGQCRAAPRCEPIEGPDSRARAEPLAASSSISNGRRLASGIVTPVTGITWGGGGAAAGGALPPSGGQLHAATAPPAGGRGRSPGTLAAAVGAGVGEEERTDGRAGGPAQAQSEELEGVGAALLPGDPSDR